MRLHVHFIVHFTVILFLASPACSRCFLSVHEFSGFENCNVLVYEFDVVEAGEIRIPLVRVGIDIHIHENITASKIEKLGNEVVEIF
jgi:hypothetical protein